LPDGWAPPLVVPLAGDADVAVPRGVQLVLVSGRDQSDERRAGSLDPADYPMVHGPDVGRSGPCAYGTIDVSHPDRHVLDVAVMIVN
jgi:hypothetical protein